MPNERDELWYSEDESDTDDAYLQFCYENFLDPDSKKAQHIWADRIDRMNDNSSGN